MEQARARSFSTKWLWALFGVGFVVAVVWLVLYAPLLVNNKAIMPLRNTYFDRLGRLYQGKPVYTLRVTAVDSEGIYTYQLAGRVVSIDYASQVMTIRDMWGKEWQLHFSTSRYPGMGGLIKLVVNQAIIEESGERRQQLTSIVIDPSSPETTQGLLPHEMVIVRWQDSRKAGRIEGIIDLSSDKIIPIIRVVVEGAQ